MKKILLIIALLISCTLPVAAKEGQGVPVLLYHHVSDISAQNPEFELSVTPQEFDRQMGELKKAGFTTISPQELLDFMNGDAEKMPQKPILITFDDGYEDNYIHAVPILKKYDFKATLFMVGINVDRKARLSKQQMNAMVKAGWNISSHSLTHPDLNALSHDKLQSEIVGSRKKIEQATGKNAGFFAYPGGFYKLQVLNKVEGHYQGAFTILSGINLPERDNVFLMRRIPVFRYTDFDELLQKLNNNKLYTNSLDY